MKKVIVQLFAGDTVYPVHNNKFYIGIAGRASTSQDMVVIKGMLNFKPQISSDKETWKPMDLAGWERNAVTGKALSIGLSGKRQYGDPGNDFIANRLLSMGGDCESVFIWELPSGSKLQFDCVIDLTTPAGGDTTNIDGLEFDILSDGIPTFDQDILDSLTFVCADHATAGATKIDAVVPILTAGNSYLYKINGGLPLSGELMSGKGWATYVLTEALPAVNANSVSLVEVDATLHAVKGGTALTVVT